MYGCVRTLPRRRPADLQAGGDDQPAHLAVGQTVILLTPPLQPY